jgi:signal transduction histidine kinase
MKLFVKIFLCSVATLSLFLSLSAYILISSSFESFMDREIDQAKNQYTYIKYNIQSKLLMNKSQKQSVRDKYDLSILDVSRYTIEGNQIAILNEDKKTISSNLANNLSTDIVDEISEESLICKIEELNDSEILIVGGSFEDDGRLFYLITATNISEVLSQKREMEGNFDLIYFTAISAGMIIMMILSTIITRPIKRLIKSTSRIANGFYNDRIEYSGKGEFGELAESFNKMVEAVEEKVIELEDIAEKREDFVTNFAHELKTPLTSVIGYADMIFQRDLPREETKNAARYILEEGLRLEALSFKLMDLTVLNKQSFILEQLSSKEVFQNIVDTLKPILKEKQIDINLQIEEEFIDIEFDLFKMLILNLIDNSIKADAKIIKIIGNKIDNGRYRISVIDDGRGIPKKEISRITEAFYMVDKSRSRAHHGVGLGLALCEKIARIHKSKLSISSEENEGTTIMIEVQIGGGNP